MTEQPRASGLERFLNLFTVVRPGEAKTALLLAKFMRGRPIFAMARREAACRRATLYPGVTGLSLVMPVNTDRMIADAKARLERLGLVRRGDRLVIVSGSARVRGATNLMKVDTV